MNGVAVPHSGSGAPGDGLEALLDSEQWQWEAIPNLDQFFTRIYRQVGAAQFATE